MELFILYLWLKLDSFAIALDAGTGILFWASALALLVCLFSHLEKNYTIRNWFRKFASIGFVVATSMAIMGVLLPSTNQTAVLVGAHYALKLADTPEAGKVMTVLRKKANELLDAELAK